jgi:hypothetical protein
MTFDEFTDSASSTLFDSAAKWFASTIPQPPGSTPAPKPAAPSSFTTIIQGVDAGTVMKYAGIAAAGLLAVYFITRKKGGRR